MKLIYLFIPLLFLGCAVDQPRAETRPIDPPASVPGTALDLPEGDDVRNPEALKAYPAGRYEDPNDPSIMHEAHTVYRAEQPASWNLNPTVSTSVPLGPTVAVTDPAKQTAPLPGELDQLLQATYEQNARLTDELKKLQVEVAKTRAIAAANESLQKQVSDLQAALAKVQQAQTRLQALNRPPAVSSTPVVPVPPKLSWWQLWSSTSTQTNNPTTERKK
jgi:hypothetical protein